MKYTHLIQRRGLTKAIVIALSICFLLSTNEVDAMECNTHTFMHLLPNKVDTNILSKLDSIIDGSDLDYGDRSQSLLTDALANICDNPVGNTMFRILLTKLPPGQRIKIINLAANDATKDQGSRYSHTTHTVKINLNMYHDDGSGIQGRQYYGIDENGNIIHKPKSLAGSLFHEFTHCLHHVSNSKKYMLDIDKKSLPKGILRNTWTNKEERRTISGYIDSEIYDPICDHMFDYHQSIMKKEPFCPRYSHLGYDSHRQKKDKNNREKLQKCLQFDKKLMNQ
jgi:hypothetical protein